MRKQPKQKRSRELVDSLVDATARVLAERGLDYVTTNHIAEAAGVSVGSLYQYFPDKESLVEALLERLVNDMMRTFNQTLGDMNPGSMALQDLARTAIAIGLAALRSNPIYLELLRNWHRLPVAGPLDQLEQYFMTVGRLYFLEHFRRYPVENLQARLYVMINSTLFTLTRYLGQESPMLKEQAVLDALVDMIAGSLAGVEPMVGEPGQP